MYFADYYKETISGKMWPVLGDRGVFILDGRNTRQTMINDAIEFGKKYGHTHFKIEKGESLLRSKPITPLIVI